MIRSVLGAGHAMARVEDQMRKDNRPAQQADEHTTAKQLARSSNWPGNLLAAQPRRPDSILETRPKAGS